MSTGSTWHPALMPNSATDIISSEPTDVIDHDRETSDASTTAPGPLPATKSPAFPEPVMPTQESGEGGLSAGSIEDNTAHPELSNLRSALTTSLASPGGVELDENPQHDAVSNHDGIEEKNDFPSEGPAPPNKHLSTVSFARTAQEVNWGEDDEVDPEWNIQRPATDPFKLLAKSDRTNSFPQVPPLHSMSAEFEPLHNQTGEIMHEVEQETRDLFGDESADADAAFFVQGLSQSGGPVDSLTGQQESVKSDLGLGLSFGGDYEPEDEQARFEEGLPLVQAPENAVQPAVEIPAFLGDSVTDGEDFFAQVGIEGCTSEGAPLPPSLERKSTMQVMDSLHFQPHEQTHAIIPEENDMASSQSSLERSTGGGIAVSASTVLSQVLADPDSSADAEAEPSDDDLAARWKAALAGDDFLEDDEFLPDDDDDEPAGAQSTAIDPAALFGDDDEGFLDDEDSNIAPGSSAQLTSPPIPAPVTSPNGHMVGFDSLTGSAHIIQATSTSNRYLPTGQSSLLPPAGNLYAPSTPLLTDLSNPATATSASSPYSVGNYPVQQPQQARPELPKAQSFANQAKGGYSSPYDLPMEVVKPRKRVSMQQMNRGYSTTAAPTMAPPPRSASTQLPPPSRGSTSSLSPPTSSQSFQPSQLQGSAPGSAQPPKTVKKSASGFFEDLPMSSRPKPAPRHTSSLNSASSQYSPQIAPNEQFAGPPAATPYTPPIQQQSFQPPPAQSLFAPDRVSPYAAHPTNVMALPVPAASNRYSPAPPSQPSQTALPPSHPSRYSPAPPSSARPPFHSYSSAPGSAPPPVLAHQPRTSSPLAHFERSQDHRPYASQVETTLDRRSSSSTYESTLRTYHLPSTREVDETGASPSDQRSREAQNQYSPQVATFTPALQPTSQTPPPIQELAAEVGNSPPKRATSNYLPQQPAASQPFNPPKRSQTQSPTATFARTRLDMDSSSINQRPASVEVPSSPRVKSGIAAQPSSRPRGFSHGLNYITPIDGREHDPMQRWRGAPVVVWGLGGTVVSSFPKDIPRYGMNSSAPMVVRSPGDVKIRNIKAIDPLQERLTSFPGPLKGKSKKKEVVSWLTAGINMLEREASYLRSASALSHEDKRTEERILLWKILRVFIDNDGVLEGNPVVDKAVRVVLSPGIDEDVSGSAPLYATGAELSGISHSSNSTTNADPVDPAAVDQLRKHLLRGDREKAVWEAVDKRLWAHAMLISNTVSKDLYKQVAQEFVQKEVKNIGENTESLAALYEIFAGNFEESIDELVPSSARAGFQMVSTSNATGSSKDALDGLDRWRETLGLVLSNRSTDDSQALNALGKLLSGYGRAEAAHICFLFARNFSVFGGIDDPKSSIVLVGSDHLRQPYDFDREMEPILLSEVFEYGTSLSSTSNTTSASPHLSIYKLQHATILAEYGYREKALQYCEAVASSITSQTRRSPYHHASLVSALDDLSKRLKSSPKDGSSSWISKPSIDKVSGSVWATFNKFVAGDENTASGPGSATGSVTESGPFARIAGGTPTISRSPSSTDMYGSYNGGMNINGAVSSAIAGSRYAPGAAHTPPNHDTQLGTSYGSQPRSSLEGRYSGDHRRGQYDPQRQVSDHRPDSQSSSINFPAQSNSAYTPQSPYTPYSNDSPYLDASSPYAPQASTPTTAQCSPMIYSSPQPASNYDGQQPPASYTSPETSYELQTSGYEPPSSGGYEPPSSSYEPYQEPESPVSTRPKKSFMDDDEDEYAAPKPPSSEKTKAEKDREADEAFRKAAEADAAKSAVAEPAKKGWGLGGWFGGAKKEPDPSAQANKPIRAKLGEASSFVYDPDQKRWVNKKAGADDIPTPSATPPPPKAAGPPRVVSGPPGANFTSSPRLSSGPPQRAGSRSSDLDGTSNDIGGSAPLPVGGAGLGASPAMSRSASNGSAGPQAAPPSRPGTGMSSASSIDDLLGPPILGARKAAGKKAKKGRGYVDVMSDKAVGA